MERDKLETGYRLRERTGAASFEDRRSGVGLIVYDGGVTSEVVPPLQESMNALLAEHGRLSMFIDAEKLQSYTTDFRKQWTVWLKERRSRISSCHILFRSAVVRMGVNLVNPLIGGFIVPYSDRSRFERALLDASARAEAPTSP